jgi:DNA processing protein
MATEQLFEIPTIDFDPRLLLAILTTKLNLNISRYEQILGFYESLGEAVNDNFDKLQSLNPKWLFGTKKSWSLQLISKEIEVLHSNLIKNNIEVLSFEDLLYPQQLLALENYPLILYYQGNLELLQSHTMVTVVGSRNIDLYAKVIMDKILAPACKLGVGVVSGLAIGVDGYSHNIALENNAPTIGVIGSGLDEKSFYPSGNWGLRNRILGIRKVEQKGFGSLEVENTPSASLPPLMRGIHAINGLVISEYPPLSKPNLYTFPQRNRLLAALTDLTWVVQASPKSGSLITSTRARDLNKTVATTPADIRNHDFGGNIELLKVGASIITETEDLLTLLNLKTHPEINVQNNISFGSNEEEKVYNLLSLTALEIEELSSKSSYGVSDIITHLTLLELNGLAINIGENRWIKGG